MGKEYLTEGAVFRCREGMRFQTVPTRNKVKYNGKGLLTSPTMLAANQPPIPCKLLPPLPNGMPAPCTCISACLRGGVKHKAGGAPLLTMSAKAICTLTGQSITPSRSGSNNHVIYGDAKPAVVPPIALPPQGKAAEQDVAKKAGRAEKTADKPQTAVPLTQATSVSAQQAAPSSPISSAAQAEEKPKAQTAHQENAAPAFRPGMLCSASPRNPACASCNYRLDNAEAAVDNDSIVLRRNYNATKPHTDGYDRYFDEVVEPLGDSKSRRWSYAAHHLISGNQVFKQNAELVRLARFCGYDINAYANCIMLVGYPEGYPFDAHGKSVSAYEVMSEGRVQWHVGGHSYRFDADEKTMICKQIGIRNKIKLTPPDIKTYAELVQEEIEKLKERLTSKKDRRMTCYMETTAKRAFCERLHRISRKIKDKLAAFSDVGKPHHSFPYFVSREAYLYTYALPRTAKVVTVWRDGTQLKLERYRLEHFTEAIADQHRSFIINPKGSTVLDLAAEGWREDCIVFCENVEFFVFLVDTPRDILPFAVDAAHQFPPPGSHTGTDGFRYIEEYDTDILVWLRDHMNASYVSPAQMAAQRMGVLRKQTEEAC